MPKEPSLNTNQKWRAANPDAVKAHWTVQNEIRAGRLVPGPCLFCGRNNTHAHHDDYFKPLDVVWLCSKCHREWHAALKGMRVGVKRVKKPARPMKSRFMPSPKRDSLETLACSLKRSGLNYAEIASELGVVKSSVYKWINNPSYN